VTGGRLRALRFVNPVLDEPAGSVGLQISSRGGLELVSDEAAIRQSLLLLLSTAPGERVMRPDYGADLQSLVFSPNDDTTAGLALHYVRRAVQRWERRVDILRLVAGRNAAEPGNLEIDLEYRVRASQRLDGLRFSLNLSGEPR
jgi:uncharacterized protein